MEVGSGDHRVTSNRTLQATQLWQKDDVWLYTIMPVLWNRHTFEVHPVEAGLLYSKLTYAENKHEEP